MARRRPLFSCWPSPSARWAPDPPAMRSRRRSSATPSLRSPASRSAAGCSDCLTTPSVATREMRRRTVEREYGAGLLSSAYSHSALKACPRLSLSGRRDRLWRHAQVRLLGVETGEPLLRVLVRDGG